MLCALSLDWGSGPVDEASPRFVYEDGLRAIPSMALVLAFCDIALALAEVVIDVMQTAHGEQRVEL